jgi:hypothetical protein
MAVEKPQLVPQNHFLDFGKGFYTTEDKTQALSFADEGEISKWNQTRLTTILVFLVPQILSLIISEYAVNDKRATEMLYASKLFATLEEEQTKLWHLSANALFEMFQEELQP